MYMITNERLKLYIFNFFKMLVTIQTHRHYTLSQGWSFSTLSVMGL